ncbi:uncharacterized protein RHOBADRAFT_55585 [Rhodotorula graminis WP1]|uniref:Alpha/beta hydrolase fold-3 domain-containing protein n=1 Tax=Rhodotorula graminis (strain WP1) TaxID=578459 RepID=A0A0P9EMC4_RHOGW|nr:uncharacterized protein RHOBADRAFT_55585 [Rhodotorula graminis WP1]KPV72921.1 hypothetical protein RHOBADRAFT_55585 [Rhodotorula graminis WP1]
MSSAAASGPALPAQGAPTAPSKIATTMGMLSTALQATFRHLTAGPPAPTWPVFLSVIMAVMRWRSVSLVRARQINPPKSHDEVVHIAKEQRDATEKLIATPADKVQDGIVKEVQFAVKKRGLEGVLAELDAEETGQRTLTAEWLSHVSLVRAPQLARTDKVILSLHGGAHVRMSPSTHRAVHVALSDATRCRIFSLDYRLSPEVRYPASLLDAVNAYLYLTDELEIPASNILVEGDSAGGNLCIALMMYLRDTKLPQVGGAILLSPWVDLSTSFKSWDENKGNDYLVIDNHADPLHPPRLYLSSSLPELEQSHHVDQLSAPYVSPALGPLDSLSNLPPLLVQSGGLECLRDEITVFVRRARKAGTDVTHQAWTDGIHVFHALQATLSGASAMREVTSWVERLFPPSSASTSASSPAPAWAQRVDALLRAERDARLARAGPVPPAKAPSTVWAYERSVERMPRVEVKREGIEAARTAAHEAEEVEGEMGLTEVFRPKRVGGGWFS